ncbi:MAG: hypothetical protein BroJett018_50980 [Chloroflexota bacterium]|nr:MAG: hypothetical protein BroJett018_50980 [Chloroflexota bacterium]
MTEPTPPIEITPAPSRVGGLLTDILIIGLMVGAILLNVFAPLWLKPPRLALTSWLYVGSVFVWIPFYAWKRRHTPRRTRTVLTIVVGGMMMCFICAVLGPSLKSIFALGFLDRVECEEIEVAGSRVRYECIRIAFEGDTGDEGRSRLTLEGVDWLPIVWRVE